MEMIGGIIDYKFLSVNSAWKGRRFKTKEYDDWRFALELILPKYETIKGWVEVELIFYTKSFARVDIDNTVKTLMDSLVNKGYIEDDRKVTDLIVRKRRREKDQIEFKIKPSKEM